MGASVGVVNSTHVKPKMALRSLVEGDCGAANPLVQWTSHFSQDKSMLKGSRLEHDRLADVAHHGNHQALEEQMVNEFLSAPQRPAVPQSFNMSTLLGEVQGIEQPPPHLRPPDEDVRVKEWVQEYGSPQPQNVVAHGRHGDERWLEEFHQQHQQTHQQTQADQWSQEFVSPPEQQWVDEFAEQMKAGKDLASVAKEMSETITDDDIQATEFMKFVKKLADGEVTIDDQTQITDTGPRDEWAEQFTKEAESQATPNGGFWDKLEKEWEELAKQDAHPWLSDYQEHQHETKEYSFQEDNPLKSVENPLEEGLKRLKEGDLPSAVLLFEADVQTRPDSVKGWQYLGSTQADNEQDIAAIAALRKCLELDPSNLAALMSLAVCYTNEAQQTKVQVVPVCRLPGIQADFHCCPPTSPSYWEALDALKEWLKHNPLYSSLEVSSASRPSRPFVSSFMTKEEHSEVRDLFLQAAQISPDRVDADIQVGLGVLFNLSSEYDKAVDCFSAALEVRPDDAMLWNKLGATLANGNRSEEAVAAYHKALQYLPGFTRSRYNLGVSCINLGAHREAVEHFLTALNMQRHAKGPQGSKRQMSEGIWSTLRLAITFLGQQHLYKLLESRDLDGLLREFSVE